MTEAAEKLSGKLGLDTTDFKTALGAANRELRVLESGFKASAAALNDWTKDATGLESRVKSLTGQIDIQKLKVAALAEEHSRLVKENGENSRAAQDAEIKLNKETETLNKMERELGTTETALKNMKEGEDKVGKAANEMGQDIGKSEKKVHDLRKSLVDFGNSVNQLVVKSLVAVRTAVLGVLAALGGLGALAFKAGDVVGTAFDTLRTKTTASGEALEQLQEDFKAVFTDVPTEAQPAAEVLALLYERLGLTGEAAQTTAKQILEMSRLMGEDAVAAGEAFTRMMQDAGLAPEEASVALDKIFVASQKSGIGINRLMELAVQFGSPMRLMGFTIDDTISLLSKWEKEGVNTELVMGSLRIAAGKFADEGKPLRESLLDTFDSIKNNTDATAALADGMDVFGARAGPDMVAAIREGRFEIDDMVAALQNADDSILSTSDELKGAAERWTEFKNKATVALAPLGEKLDNIAAKLLEKAMPTLDKFADIIEQFVVPAIDSIMESFANFDGDIIGAIADILYKFGFNLENALGVEGANEFFSNLADGFISLTQAVGSFVNDTLIPFVTQHSEEIKAALIGIGAALAAAGIVGIIAGIIAAINPVTVVIAAIVAAVGLLSAAWAGNWGGIRDIVTQIWEENLQPALQALWEFLSTTIPAALQSLSSFWTGTLLPAIQAVWGFLSGSLFPLFQAIAEFIGAVFNLNMRVLAGLWQNVLFPALQKVYGFLNANVFPIFRAIGSYLSDTFQPIIHTLANFIKNNLSPAFGGISKAIETAIGWLKDMADAINNLSLPAWLTPGSPTPWELGLIGINEAMAELNQQLPRMAFGLSQVNSAGSSAPTVNNTSNTQNETFQFFAPTIIPAEATTSGLGARLKGRRF